MIPRNSRETAPPITIPPPCPTRTWGKLVVDGRARSSAGRYVLRLMRAGERHDLCFAQWQSEDRDSLLRIAEQRRQPMCRLVLTDTLAGTTETLHDASPAPAFSREQWPTLE